MQKIGILNSEIAKVLADMGHTDTIVIGDCGLPVPDGVKKIDLALKLGTPRFLEVVEELVKYMEIEKIHVAAEMQRWKSKKSTSLPKCRAKTKPAGRKCTDCSATRNGLLPTTSISNRLPELPKQLSAPAKLRRLPTLFYIPA